jgi:DNA-binding IclR family transcriptional regulator/nitroimidazol reductase NimA-like FMN-containing flavoprotein (pyridoxamine 5'-phosphate oxidase superfamily)
MFDMRDELEYKAATAVPAIERAAAALGALAEVGRAGLALSELARRAGLSKSTAHALLATLVARGFVARGRDGRFRLGPALIALGQAAARASDLLEAFLGPGEALAERWGETVELAVAANGGVLVLSAVEGRRRLHAEGRCGVVRAADGSAAARALLGGEAPALWEEAEDGLLELAAPVRDGQGQIRAALSVAGPRERLRPVAAELARDVQAGAAAISGALGAPPAAAGGGPEVGPLSHEELDSFLAGGRLARLSCVRPDGFPHTVPVWYEWDGRVFWIVARARAEWTGYLQANSRVSLAIDESEPPLRRLLAEGLAHFEEPAARGGRWRVVRRRMAQRYLAAPQRGPDAALERVPHVLVRIEPLKMTTWRGLLPHPRYQRGETSIA